MCTDIAIICIVFGECFSILFGFGDRRQRVNQPRRTARRSETLQIFNDEAKHCGLRVCMERALAAADAWIAFEVDSEAN